jgi:hypothetical protein
MSRKHFTSSSPSSHKPLYPYPWCIVIVSYHDYYNHTVVIVLHGQRISCPTSSSHTRYHALP